MSLNTSGVAPYCEDMRTSEWQKWRDQCDRARREGSALDVAANFYGGQGRGEGRRGEGHGEGAGQGGQALVVLPDCSVVEYRDIGDDNLVGAVLMCIYYYFLNFSLRVLKTAIIPVVTKYFTEARGTDWVFLVGVSYIQIINNIFILITFELVHILVIL